MTPDPSEQRREDETKPVTSSENEPRLGELGDALSHIDTQLSSGGIAAGAAKGILYSLIETIGALVGDPDLPEHSREGYAELLEAARELRAKLTRAGGTP
jgi:hypothetical protein